MSHHNYQSPETICVHAGIVDNEYGAVVPPICQTSTFKFKNVDHGAALFAGQADGYIYTRMRNPTVEAMEDAVAALEGGYKALGCGSGMAAVSTTFTAMLSAGDHIICADAVYGPTVGILQNIFTKYGVEASFVDASNIENVRNAVKPNTKVIHIESPGNPTLAMVDIAECAKIAHENGARLVVDNTFMSPILQKPFELGADVIVHSMTKFLNGHADVVAGIIIVKDKETYAHFRKTLNLMGGTIDPFNSFLVHRGIKTLKIRMDVHTANAQKVAEFLEAHPKIERVFYPGLKSHPQYELGLRQMKSAGGMIAFELKGGLEAGKKMMDSVKLCQLAVSLGGVESLIQHPATMTHAGVSKEIRLQSGITDGLVRLSVGIESADDIIADLNSALENA